MLGALGGLELVPGIDLLGLLRLPEPYGILLIGGVLLPTVYVVSNAIANLLFKDALILKVGGESRAQSSTVLSCCWEGVPICCSRTPLSSRWVEVDSGAGQLWHVFGMGCQSMDALILTVGAR